MLSATHAAAARLCLLPAAQLPSTVTSMRRGPESPNGATFAALVPKMSLVCCTSPFDTSRYGESGRLSIQSISDLIKWSGAPVEPVRGPL